MSNYIIANGELYHAGIKGMRWGVRRFQNSDGTLTEAGKKRYGRSRNSDNTDSASKKTKKPTPKDKERASKAILKGARIASKLAMASAVDDMFYDGAGKKLAKEAVKQTGRAAVTAYTMARGGYDIRWYDK